MKPVRQPSPAGEQLLTKLAALCDEERERRAASRRQQAEVVDAARDADVSWARISEAMGAGFHRTYAMTWRSRVERDDEVRAD